MTEPDEDYSEEQRWRSIESIRQVDSDELWDNVFALRKAGTKKTFQRAVQWCSDPDAFRRSIGVSILAQFGPDLRGYPQESCAIIRQMLTRENDQEVITSLISAVSFRELHDGLAWLQSLADHPDEDVRWRVAWALPISNSATPEDFRSSVKTLLKLMKDPEAKVRDWATFSIAMTEDDSPEIRDALLERLSDSDFDTRSEAVVGLAMRKDPNGIEPLIKLLQSDRVGELYVEAAESYRDTRLKPALLSLKKWWDINPDLLDRAIEACS